MINKWLSQSFTLAKKNYSDTFAQEPFIEFGMFKGMLQPITGRLSTRSGKDAGEAAYMLYAEIGVDVEPGDRVTTAAGREFIAQFVQAEGISGMMDHMEITLEATT